MYYANTDDDNNYRRRLFLRLQKEYYRRQTIFRLSFWEESYHLCGLDRQWQGLLTYRGMHTERGYALPGQYPYREHYYGQIDDQGL